MGSLEQKAVEFLKTTWAELGKTASPDDRIAAVLEEIHETGTYTHTFEELEHGAKMAWRNSNRCIGRLFWRSLKVQDSRHVQDEKSMFEALQSHITYATNDGKIRPTITVFSPKNNHTNSETRIWNHQLIRYAGYRNSDGSVTGDPASLAFTEECHQLGWQGNGGPFDLLPVVVQLPGREPAWQELPKDIVAEVPLSHPQFDWFGEMGWKWYALPVISDMKLEIGGIEYTAAPFNGWYMGTEIGARNLADTDRYNLLPVIAEKMQLDTSAAHSLWKDRALVELNTAVLFSFEKHGFKIVDHHSASEQFMAFEMSENRNGRDVTGDWNWLVPPMSGAATEVFHREWKDEKLSPNFEYQAAAWEQKAAGIKKLSKCPFSKS